MDVAFGAAGLDSVVYTVSSHPHERRSLGSAQRLLRVCHRRGPSPCPTSYLTVIPGSPPTCVPPTTCPSSVFRKAHRLSSLSFRLPHKIVHHLTAVFQPHPRPAQCHFEIINPFLCHLVSSPAHRPPPTFCLAPSPRRDQRPIPSGFRLRHTEVGMI